MIKIEPRGPGASEDQLRDLTAVAGALPADIVELLKEQDGATPESNAFVIRKGTSSGVSQVLTVRELIDLLGVVSFPRGHLPWASAEGGNYLTITDDGGIYFWDHETDETIRLAGSLASFWDHVRPANNDWAKEKIKTMNVKAWIDPELLKKETGG